ncbi:MAG: hypothetical protein IIV74_01370, partial [Alphaproteobacteria bacterium]|nr:hypothetical protein [Alphaproteobacteria bacterium]
DVVNKCYDEQTKSLKDFSNVKEQLLLGSRLELSEQMCREKLDTCSNLYGGGTHGMAELITAMHNITSQKIAKECRTTLESYARDMCSVPSNDSLHSYPYACRVYTPGEQQYASIHTCNLQTHNANKSYGNDDTSIVDHLPCGNLMTFTSCNPGYYLIYNNKYDADPKPGNQCAPCPVGYTCHGETAGPEKNEYSECGDYVGSLYHKLARYAMQACVRPSESNNSMPATVLQDISVVMDKIRTEMAATLSDECERLGGKWVDTIWISEKERCDINTQKCELVDNSTHHITGDKLLKVFYTETSANTKWGYCADTDKETDNSLQIVPGNTNNENTQ